MTISLLFMEFCNVYLCERAVEFEHIAINKGAVTRLYGWPVVGIELVARLFVAIVRIIVIYFEMAAS